MRLTFDFLNVITTMYNFHQNKGGLESNALIKMAEYVSQHNQTLYTEDQKVIAECNRIKITCSDYKQHE